MDRDELIGKAKTFFGARKATVNLFGVEELMADFALSLIGTREFIDLQSTLAYEAGQRAERERVSAVATEAVAWLTDIEPGCSGVGCDYCQKLAEFRAVIEVDNG